METTQPARTTIAEDIEIVGSLKCGSDIELSGKLNGDLNCNGAAVIGEKAVIKGNITATSISIRGQVNGNVSVKDRIELKSSARLNGDIRAKRLTVEDGVTFIGKSEVNPAGPSAARGSEKGGEEDAEASAAPADAPESDGRKSGVFGRR
jgi:cytoskeletal protein CcmA (bactofilin family)